MGWDAARPESGAALTSVDRMAQVTLADLEAMRLLLHGSSVIDWHQLAFTDLAQVHRFPAGQRVRSRVGRGHGSPRRAAQRGRRVPATPLRLSHPRRDRRGRAGHRSAALGFAAQRHQTYARIVLKVMLVLHHLDGRERLIRMPVSDVQLFGLVEAKVVQIVDELRGAGLPIVEFAWSRKGARQPDHQAARQARLDRRPRLRQAALPPHHAALRRSGAGAARASVAAGAVQFCDAGTDGESAAAVSRILRDFPLLRRHQDGLQAGEDINLGETADNSFSAETYRVINFVADLPLRVSQVMRHLNLPNVESEQFDPGGIIFVLTEFQVMDAATNLANEQGESSHQAYKERQHIEVKARLTRA